ncbi:MAG TPA: PorV/PorQ family protein [Chitinophagales bacterium]|nr:PorV/PorQ family protein [Chitinophagales bacterium]HMX05791.1 PorV/PorQ family protein [Chitinophagales bacterium]HMZ90039.1 PorV/PorQ family protein [Chitinophagales bacterium]HNA56961.1 PorV/PorQ family protein [Chitinophagales bacterium]HNE45951.1 PorV/PorQ family protein [Chitinophagales bacterium]
MRKLLLMVSLLWGLQPVGAQILPSYGDSRTATTGWQFLKIAPDGRSAGMSEAFLAVVDDVSSLYWNAAGLTQLDSNRLHFGVQYTDYAAGTSMNFGGVSYRIDDNTLIGVSMQYFDAGEMDVTTEFLPFGNGQTFRATDLGLGISLARELTDMFSLGITAKYVREDLASVHNQNIVFDFGFQYDIGVQNTRFAVAITNFGFNTQPGGEIAVVTLSDSIQATDFTEIAVPTVFRLGFAWDAIKNEKHILTTAFQLNHPTDNNETYSLGLEYSWKQLFYARTGYTFATDRSALPAFGFGTYLHRNYGTIKFDYGFNYDAVLGMINKIGIAYTLPNGIHKKSSATH